MAEKMPNNVLPKTLPCFRFRKRQVYPTEAVTEAFRPAGISIFPAASCLLPKVLPLAPTPWGEFLELPQVVQCEKKSEAHCLTLGFWLIVPRAAPAATPGHRPTGTLYF